MPKGTEDTLTHLRREVVRGPTDGVGQGRGVQKERGDPEVAHLDHPFGRQEHVPGLQIAVQHFLRVRRRSTRCAGPGPMVRPGGGVPVRWEQTCPGPPSIDSLRTAMASPRVALPRPASPSPHLDPPRRGATVRRLAAASSGRCTVPHPPSSPPGRSLCYCTCAQEAISTKSAGRKWLVSGLKDHRYLSVTKSATRRQPVGGTPTSVQGYAAVCT